MSEYECESRTEEMLRLIHEAQAHLAKALAASKQTEDARDRYRKALEAIVSEDAACGLNLKHGLRAVVQIAREALAPEEK